MKIVGFANMNKDIAYCVLENGRPVIHAELERYSRIKEGPRDSDPYRFFMDTYPDWRECTHGVNTVVTKVTSAYKKCKNSFLACERAFKRNNGEMVVLGHHLAHAANAYYSSNFDDAFILTIDGGGEEIVQDTETGEELARETSLTAFVGAGTKIENIRIYPPSLNIGRLWTTLCKDVYNLPVGPPFGHKAGTLMAMGAYGNADTYLHLFVEEMDNGTYRPKVLENIGQLQELIRANPEAAFDIAASLQFLTEFIVFSVLDDVLGDEKVTSKNLCLAGGVTLNSVMTHKIYERYEGRINNIYCAPVPYDSGLAIGNAQYYWHHVLDNPRIKWEDNFTPYLGELYSKEEILEVAQPEENLIIIEENVEDAQVVDLLNDQKIVAVFGGPSESGRRALGNRSILTDPRSPTMKDHLNEKVKHRQWWRPFAPSILREEVSNWFVRDYDSPYMSFVNMFKEEVQEQVPAVLHKDGSARLQTVTKADNPWYYGFIKKWHDKTGVPILLNTSFNDREPIVEKPQDAVNCFVTTNIDYLYFYEHGILLSHREKNDD